MKTEVADVSEVERRVTVELDAKPVAAAIDKAYKNLRKKVRLPGFRPGKAPLSILQKHFKAQVEEEEQKSGKKRPEQVVEKIVTGKLEKWMSDACLVEQSSVMEEEKTIQQLTDELSAKIGEKIAVRRFVRYELGEGVEKKKEDFATEVASTLAE